MKKVKNQLRVTHIPQLPMNGFHVSVQNEREAYLILDTLAQQHLWLYKEKVIPDYSNAIFVEMLDEDGVWVDYYNEAESLDWDEFVEAYNEYINGKE